jgi:hypothetical protein
MLHDQACLLDSTILQVLGHHSIAHQLDQPFRGVWRPAPGVRPGRHLAPTCTYEIVTCKTDRNVMKMTGSDPLTGRGFPP